MKLLHLLKAPFARGGLGLEPICSSGLPSCTDSQEKLVTVRVDSSWDRLLITIWVDFFFEWSLAQPSHVRVGHSFACAACETAVVLPMLHCLESSAASSRNERHWRRFEARDNAESRRVERMRVKRASLYSWVFGSCPLYPAR